MTIITDKKDVRRIFNAISRQLSQEKNKEELTKLVKLGSVKWANGLTKELQKVDDVYILGWYSGERPLIINKVKICVDGNIDYVVINNKFSHVNMASFPTSRIITLKGDGKILPLEATLEFEGQEFCNPITALHVLETPNKDIVPLLKVTLSSQNFDDAYSSYESVENAERDIVLKENKTYRFLLKDNSSPIEMILGLSGNSLRQLSSFELNRKLREVAEIKKDEIWAKAKEDTSYEKISVEYYRKHRDKFSKYYPTFNYKEIKDMKIEVSKDKYDLGVYGLGSAGTAILDQICRSNWVKNIYLCDFDRVENKNLINQWYSADDIGCHKSSSSYSIIKRMERPISDGIIGSSFLVEYDNARFQNTELETKAFKYVVSGFDSISARQDFLNAILDGKIEAKYLIDCRYLDLACSIYMIDLENSEEIEFYKANLEADAELIKIRNEKEKLTKEEFENWYDRKGYFTSGCRSCRKETLQEVEHSMTCVPRQTISCCNCRSVECIDYLYDLYLKSCPNPKISITDASCVKYNYIDIYKYVGAIVFGAIRSIENENGKPFSLVEAETDVKGLPNYMVVRR